MTDTENCLEHIGTRFTEVRHKLRVEVAVDNGSSVDSSACIASSVVDHVHMNSCIQTGVFVYGDVELKEAWWFRLEAGVLGIYPSSSMFRRVPSRELCWL